MELKKLYKKPSIFGVMGIKRKLEYELKERRRKRRTQDFEENREKISTSQDDDRRKKLLEWKQEQERKKKATKLQQKPPFKIGIVHHHIYSPAANTRISAVTTKGRDVRAKSIVKKRITKATEKRLLAKAADATRKAIILSSNSNTVDSKSLTTCDTNEHGDDERKSFAPIDHKFKPPAGLREIPLLITTSVEDNRSRKNDVIACDRSANYIDVHDVRGLFRSSSIEMIALGVSSDGHEASDCSREKRLINHPTERPFASSNGKVKSPSSKIFSSPSSTDAMNREHCAEDLSPYLARTRSSVGDDTVVRTFDVSSENDRRTVVEYFKRLLHAERKGLQNCCAGWTTIRSRNDIAEDIQCQIDQAIGQTTLLIEEKFQQFRDLIAQLDYKEEDRTEQSITCKDLHRFWNTIYIEVEDCLSRFANLERLRAAQEEQPSVAESFVTPVSEIRAINKERIELTVPADRSTLRMIISAERKETPNIQDHREISWRDRNTNSECFITPFRNVEGITAGKYLTPLGKEFFEGCSIGIDTSTPADRNIGSTCVNRFSTPVIPMKINQLYREFAMRSNDNTTPSCANSDQTPMRNVSEGLRKPRRQNVRQRSARKIDSNGSILSVKSSDKRSEIDRDSSEISSYNANGSNVELNSSENDCTKSNLTDQITMESVQTVIETTLRAE